MYLNFVACKNTLWKHSVTSIIIVSITAAGLCLVDWLVENSPAGLIFLQCVPQPSENYSKGLSDMVMASVILVSVRNLQMRD